MTPFRRSRIYRRTARIYTHLCYLLSSNLPSKLWCVHIHSSNEEVFLPMCNFGVSRAAGNNFVYCFADYTVRVQCDTRDICLIYSYLYVLYLNIYSLCTLNRQVGWTVLIGCLAGWTCCAATGPRRR